MAKNKDLVPITIWYSIQNDGAGAAVLAWFLTEERAEQDQDNQDEGWGESCTGSVETYEGSDIHQEAVENSNKHEYLERENYYEAKNIGTRAKSDKICEHCGKTITMGVPHQVHYFYPEFANYPTHNECSEAFINSLN